VPHDLAQVTRLLAELDRGDASAADRLFPLVYADLRSLALRYFRDQPSDHTLQPTALVHEAFLRLARQTGQYQDRVHFLAVAATAMRQILVNYAVARSAKKRGGGKPAMTLIGDLGPQGQPGFNPIELDDSLRKLAELDARKARVVELRFFGGLQEADAAAILGVSPSTARDDWRMARAWLRQELRGVDDGRR
jgi:RNA polymerase sigma factor (TIGR02999 family)